MVDLNQKRPKVKSAFFKAPVLLTLCFLLPLSAFPQDGTLDVTFDTDGIVTTDIADSSNDAGQGVVIQNDGKILVAGYGNGFTVTRYNTNGSLDNSFDSDGIVTTKVNNGGSAAAIVVQPDNKIVIAGSSSNGNDEDIVVLRYNSNGSLDTSFDTDGIVTTPIGDSTDQVFSIALQIDGKIVVAGWSYSDPNYDFAVVRYNINGSLDNTFDGDGKITTSIGPYDGAFSVKIQTDGKIVVGGYCYKTLGKDFALVRYNSNGTLDNTFGLGGKVTTQFPGPTEAEGRSLLIQPDGKIILAGIVQLTGYYYFALARYNNDGSLDINFDGDGMVTTSFAYYDLGFSALLQPDGKIVMAGATNYFMGPCSFALARYNNNGTLDNTFDTDGMVTNLIGNSRGLACSVALQNDGKIVAAGYSINGDTDFAIARYMGSSVVGINNPAKEDEKIKIYPNPFSNEVTFETPDVLNAATLTVYNTFGQKVKEIKNLSGQKITMSRDNLLSGLYFIRLTEDNCVIAARELIISD